MSTILALAESRIITRGDAIEHDQAHNAAKTDQQFTSNAMYPRQREPAMMLGVYTPIMPIFHAPNRALLLKTPILKRTFRQKCLKSTANTGFALVATLFAVALIGIGAAFFASRVEALRTSAIDTQIWAEAEREAFSTRQALMYAAITTERSVRGLEIPNAPLVADGRVYRLSDSLTISVQDERGLMPLADLNARAARRFFTSLGIPSDQHDKLLDSLLDYIDPDDLRRLNGAEKTEYAARGRQPPANDYLRTRDELATVVGWDDLLAAIERTGGSARREQFVALFTAARHWGVNLNTAPAEVLQAVDGIDPKRINALLDQRRIKPFLNYRDLSPFLNGKLDDDFALLVGANTWRVSHHKTGMPFLLECQLMLTPGGREKPAVLSACRRRPLALRESLPNGEMARVVNRAVTGIDRMSDTLGNNSLRDGAASSSAAPTSPTSSASPASSNAKSTSRAPSRTLDPNGSDTLDNPYDAPTLPWLARALNV